MSYISFEIVLLFYFLTSQSLLVWNCFNSNIIYGQTCFMFTLYSILLTFELKHWFYIATQCYATARMQGEILIENSGITLIHQLHIHATVTQCKKKLTIIIFLSIVYVVFRPDFLDCTARTSLDMLAKHYYQAVGVWVVFFVPGSDADIEFYNEFMHYLEEKQRAAVAKLDDKTTVFLVPPSEFSEKVLKVPGKLSISGVILRLEYPTLNHGPMPIEGVMKNENLLSYNENAFNPNSSFPSVRIPPPSISEYGNSGISNLSFLGNKFPAAPSVSDSARALVSMPESHDDRSRSYPPLPPQTSGPNWSSHNLQNFRSLPMQLSSAASEPIAEERQPIIPRPDINSAHHSNAISGIPLSMPVGALEPEQLVRLAETLLEQRRQSGSSLSSSAFSDPRQNRFDGSDTSQRYAAENNLVNSEFSAPQLSQLLQSQMSNVALPPQTVQREPQSEVNGNQQFRDSGSLQATLQLASALLHQLQQGKPS